MSNGKISATASSKVLEACATEGPHKFEGPTHDEESGGTDSRVPSLPGVNRWHNTDMWIAHEDKWKADNSGNELWFANIQTGPNRRSHRLSLAPRR